jgi:hypothetical protein
VAPPVDGNCCFLSGGVAVGAGGSAQQEVSLKNDIAGASTGTDLLIGSTSDSNTNQTINTIVEASTSTDPMIGGGASDNNKMQIQSANLDTKNSIDSLDKFQTSESQSEGESICGSGKSTIKRIPSLDDDMIKDLQNLRARSESNSFDEGGSVCSKASSARSRKNKNRRKKQLQKKVGGAKEQEGINLASSSFSTVKVKLLNELEDETDSTKRKRSENTPQSQIAETKKPKMASEQASYAETLTNNKVVFIRIDDDEKTMDHTCGDFLRNEICRLQYSFDQRKSFIPRFVQTYVSSNEMKVLCEDQQSMDWLLEVVESIAPFQNESFVAYTQESVPKHINLSAFFFKKKDPDVKELLARIQLSNPELQTNRWRILYGSERQAGFVLGVGVDSASFRHLQKMEMRPFFEMGRVTFQIINKKKDD